MKLNIFTADCVGNAKNCLYPNEAEVTNVDELAAALAFDHTCGQFKGAYRSIGNFEGSNVIVMDFDNDESDDPADWLSLQQVADEMQDISVAIAPSRHNMTPKDGKAARPKGHAYFPIEPTDDPDKYAAIKRGIQKKYPFFDANATDAARFIFGTNIDPAEIVWQEGWMTIDDDVEPDYGEDEELPDTKGGVIANGNRNKTLSRFAGRILKKLGECDKAQEVFLEEAKKCETPLSAEELKTIWCSALRFYRNKVSKQSGYVPPDQYNNDFADGDGGSLIPPDYSDIGEAKVLAREYGDDLKYTDATDYLFYDSECWREDKQMAVGAAEEFLDIQLADAEQKVENAKEALISAGVSKEAISAGGKKLEKEVPGDKMALLFTFLAMVKYLTFVKSRRDYKNLVAMMNAAKPMLLLSVNDLDKDGNLLNTPAGTIDLSTGEIKEHDPADFITKITECSPSDEGMDVWLAALQIFFQGDQELIDYVQEIVGLTAIGKVYQEHIIIAYGDGANGKSTFWNAIFRVLGNYAGKLSAEALTVNCKRNVKPEMAELKGKRLIIASEMEEGMRLNTAMVKQLCSTDEIFAEKKYKSPFFYTPSHTLVVYTNFLPRIGANDDGIWRRMIVIPFGAKITGASDIKNYADYLVENAGGAILTWIVEGAKRAISKNFKTTIPACVQAAIDAYREENDWLGHFIADCCDKDPAAQERSGELYLQYRAYCQQNGEYTRSTADFYSALEKAGFVRHKTNKGVVIDGISLKAGQDFM